ncbi:MAG: hypothetical protein AAB356_04260 [Deltaproteobacteria bacterium]
MPYPFSQGVFICGEPLYVNKGAGPEEMEEARARLEATLTRLTREADGVFIKHGGRIAK